MKAKRTVAITPTVHAKMQAAVDYLNVHLFDGELPDAFLPPRRTISFAARLVERSTSN